MVRHNDVRGPDSAHSRSASWRSTPPIVRFLRVPLYHKIVIANSALVGLAAVVAVVLVLSPGSSLGPFVTSGRLGAGIVVLIAVVAVVNALLVRFALSPLAAIEETARRVEGGDLSARIVPSLLADHDLSRLTDLINDMLDRIEEARQRQRELAVMVLQAEERERSQLARELSDQTAQVLAAALLQLRAAAATPGEAHPVALDKLRKTIVEALDGIRAVARNLRPPELDELGLGAAIKAHARLLSEVSDQPIVCEIEETESDLRGERGLTLYRIVREAVNNAVRHANANLVTVRLRESEGILIADVEDDGTGFDPERVPPRSGDSLGLVGIYERAAYLNGRVELDTELGRGTRLRVWVPARAPKAPGPVSSIEDDPGRAGVLPREASAP